MHDPKNRETAMIWELQVLKTLDLPSVEHVRRMLVRMSSKRQNGEIGYNDVNTYHNEKFQLIDVGTCAGEPEQRVDVTKVMVDGVCITEGQSQHASSVSHGTRKCHQLGTKYKAGTHFRKHNNIIQKWVADGHIAIIGH